MLHEQRLKIESARMREDERKRVKTKKMEDHSVNEEYPRGSEDSSATREDNETLIQKYVTQ